MAGLYRFRSVEGEDKDGILLLARQLGYSASEQTVNDLVSLVLTEENHQMVIADARDGLLGYIHMVCNCADPAAEKVEIAGILIPDKFRGKGLGSAFIKEAEKWSRSRNIKTVSIRRSLIRDEAHAFFKHHGFFPDAGGDVLFKQLS